MIRLFHKSQFDQSKLVRHMNPRFRLILTNHAKREIKEDRFGSFNVPEFIPGSFELIEVEQINGKSTKFVLRFSYDNLRDVVIVLREGRKGGYYTVVTAWSNLKTDNHNTLDISKYDDVKFINYEVRN